MQLAVLSLAFAAAFACVVLMGYAIQRGATCTVAAVDEIVNKRSARRLLAMAEASLWVAGGLVVAQAIGRLPQMPAGYALSGWTIAGGVLLGLGAWTAGACVFGAVARLGSGDWAYAAVPVGYFAGCLTVGPLFGAPMPRELGAPSPLFEASPSFALLFIALAAWRIARLASNAGLRAVAAKLWQPHAATAVIGVTFLLSLLLAGAWAYTDLLAEVARGMAERIPVRVGLFAALLAGAALGGWTAGLWRPARPSAAKLLRCAAGGALMGWGTLLIPGGNDGLILVGMPLLRPYAWAAFATMCATVAFALYLQRRLRELSHFGREGARRDSAA